MLQRCPVTLEDVSEDIGCSIAVAEDCTRHRSRLGLDKAEGQTAFEVLFCLPCDSGRSVLGPEEPAQAILWVSL